MKYFLLALWLWLPQALLAQPPLEPLQIAEQFVAPTGWPAMKGYLGGEVARQAKRQSLGQQIPAGLRRVCQLLEQGPATAVVAVELRDSVSRNDFYLHFQQEAGRWKLQAVRSLSMTRLGAPMLDLLTAMPADEVARYNTKHPEASHAFTVGNMRLWTAPDSTIAAHFARNRAGFEAAAQLVQAGRYFAQPADRRRTGEQAANAEPAIRDLLRELFISRVSQRATGCATCLEFLIVGMSGNAVGLLYEPRPAAVPPMHPDHLILLKALGRGWYLYKTT